MKKEMKAYTEAKINHVTKKVLSLNWENPKVYGDFLAQVYFYVCHTTRILGAAGSRFPLHEQKLHLQCMRHAGEEKSHEQLSFLDLKTLGFKPTDFPELPATKALYRSAYYLIERESPMAIVGYAYFLEWLAVAAGLKLLEVVEPIYGQKAVKHLTVHAKEDPEHIVAVEEMIEKLPKECIPYLEEAVSTAAHQYERLLEEIQQRSASAKVKKAA